MTDNNLRRNALDYHEADPPGKIAIHATKPVANQHDLGLAYSPGVAFACEAIAKDPATVVPLYGARQPRRRHHQRHGRPRPRQHRPARLEAGDGRQGGPVQEIRRHRRLRHRGRREGGRAVRRSGGAARADVRRHQPRGHQGAGVLRDRAPAPGAHEDPGVPRRPARHRDRGRGGHPQRPQAGRKADRRGQACLLGGRRRRARVPRSAVRARPQAREHLDRRHRRAWSIEGRAAVDGPLQGDLRAARPKSGSSPRSCPAPMFSSDFRRRAS